MGGACFLYAAKDQIRSFADNLLGKMPLITHANLQFRCYAFLAYLIHGQVGREIRLPNWVCGTKWIRKYMFNSNIVSPTQKWLNRKRTGFLPKPGSMGIPQAAMKQSTLTQLDVLREAERVKEAQELPFCRNHYELETEQDLSVQKNLQMSMPLPTFPILKTPDAKQPGVPMETQPKMTHCHHVPNRVSLLSQH